MHAEKVVTVGLDETQGSVADKGFRVELPTVQHYVKFYNFSKKSEITHFKACFGLSFCFSFLVY